MVQSPSPAQIRLGLIVGAAVLVIVGLIAVGFSVLGGEQTARPLGRTLSIAVVAPVEPEVQPGETMEVGTLRDGFDRATLERAEADADDPGYLPPDAYVGAPWDAPATPRMPKPTPVTEDPPMRAYRDVVDRHLTQDPTFDPLADGSRSFGYDKPSSDPASGRRPRAELPVATPSAGPNGAIR